MSGSSIDMKTIAIAIVLSVILSVGISYVAFQGKVSSQGPKGDTGTAFQLTGQQALTLTYDLSNSQATDEVKQFTTTSSVTKLFYSASGSLTDTMVIQIYWSPYTLDEIKANNALPHYQWQITGNTGGTDYILGLPLGAHSVRIIKTAGISRAYLAVVDLS